MAVSSTGGGNLTHVTVSTDGVDLAALEPVAAVTTAAVANSSGTSALETALKAALGAGTVVHLTDASYTVTSSIVINITTSFQGPLGIDLGGAKILSQISDGGPVIQINVAAGVDIGTLSLSNFSIQGNGLEGDGLKIVVDGADRWIRDLDIRNVNVEHVGGIGLDVLGNVSRAASSTRGCTATAKVARASPTAPAAGWRTISIGWAAAFARTTSPA